MERIPCFIRKNTPELRAKLEELGYRDAMPHISPLPEYADIVTLDNKYHQCCLDKYHAIDCGKNEKLFLALAAVGNEGDKGKWFCIVRENGATNELETRWRQCDEKKFDVDTMPYGGCIHFYPASPDEIIEHFKNKRQ